MDVFRAEEGLAPAHLSGGRVGWRGAPLSDLTYTVVDIETTGLRPEGNGITEICCLKVRQGEEAGCFSTLVDPGRPIPLFIQQMTGITDAMVRGAPSFASIVPELLGFIDGTVLVAHNAPFDLSFINYGLSGCGYGRLHHPVIDTLRLARRLLPGLPRANLDSVAAHLGVQVRSRHRARGDAEATAGVLLRLLSICRENGIVEDSQLLALLAPSRATPNPAARPRKPATPARLSVLADRCRALPDAPGVYIMRAATGRVLYVGKAISLRKRVASYFGVGALPKVQRMMERVETIEHIQVGSELEALLEESRLIKLYQPRYNVLLRSYLDYPFIRLDEGGPYPQLVVTRDTDGEGSRYFGPFRHTGGAMAVLDILAKCFRLYSGRCPARSEGEACIYLQMGRCLGPCLGGDGLTRHREAMDELCRLLEADPDDLIADLVRRRDAASERLDYESAALYRDAIEDLSRAMDRRKLLTPVAEGASVVAICPSLQPGCAELFLLGEGRLIARTRVQPSEREVCISSAREFLSLAIATAPAGGGETSPYLDPVSLDRVNTITTWLQGRGGAIATIPLEPGWDGEEAGTLLERVMEAAVAAAKIEEGS